MNTLNIEAKLAQKYRYKPLSKDLSENIDNFTLIIFQMVLLSVVQMLYYVQNWYSSMQWLHSYCRW